MIPTADEIGGPFSFNDLLESGNGGLWGTAERVAVEVYDRVVRNKEFVAEGRKRVLLVEKLGVGS